MKNKEFNIIHIGMPKVATTTLQNKIFPIIAKKTSRKLLLYKDLKIILGKSNLINHYFKIKKIKKQNCLISFESLISIDANPYFYKKNFEIIKKTFGFNSHIIIILKNPINFLNSIYLQNINNLNLKTEEDFFVSKDKYKKFIKKNNKSYSASHWCLQEFNQRKLLNLYKNSFRKVTILKIDALKDPYIISKTFNLTLMESKKITKLFLNKKLNISPGVYIVKLAFLINTILNYFNSSLLDLYKFQKNIHKRIDKSKIKHFYYLKRFLKLIFFLLNFRFLYQQILLKIFRDKPYNLNLKKFKYFNIKRELKFYNNLPKVSNFYN